MTRRRITLAAMPTTQRRTVLAVLFALVALACTLTLLFSDRADSPATTAPQPRADSYEGSSGMGADGFGGWTAKPDPSRPAR